ncbi:hypothetical protein [Streptomyces sp. NRRL S-448]|uniref:hypothetical protein n=1 Tax=Streptomyces sp. NRRL S-448 TaxID=1463907 RepID=UPI003566464B
MSATTGTHPHRTGTTPPATTTAPDHGLVPTPAGDPGRPWLPATARPTTEPPPETDDHSDDHEHEQPRPNGIQFGRRSLTACLNELSARRTRHATHSSA